MTRRERQQGNQRPSQNFISDAISKDMVQVNAVHVNVAQEYIMITEDKATLCLHEWQHKIETRNEWIAPLSLLCSLVLTTVTATFKDSFGLSKDTWNAIFVIGILLSALWLLRALVNLAKSPKIAPADIINQLKSGAAAVRRSTFTETDISIGVPKPK